MLLLSYFFSFLSGILERRNCVPLKYSRKVFNTIGKIYDAHKTICDGVRNANDDCHVRRNGNNFIETKKFQTTTNLRFIFSFLGHWIPMCALIALGYVTASEKDLAIFLLVVAVGINSSTYLGFQVCNMLIN